MTVHYQDDQVVVHHGDCRDVLTELADASVDSVVTDPPYGLEFMGKEWDAPWKAGGENLWTDRDKTDNVVNRQSTNPFIAAAVNKYRAGLPFQLWCQQWATECLRVLKPGGHLVAFGGTRTWHRLACAIEDAGFEIRDNLAWLYGSGFPKGSRVNRDERFCQCASIAHTSSCTYPEPQPADHTHTEPDEAATEHAPQSARRARHTASGSQSGCHPEHGSDGGPLHLVSAVGLASVPSPECAPAHTRSDERADDPGDESSHNPSLAPDIGHPSNQDYSRLGRSQNVAPAHTRGNTSPADTSESDFRTLDNRRDSSLDYTTGFPLCTTCGKPNADGWNVALKPAFEPIVLARKPIRGTVAANVLAHGCGALNIDSCRVAATDDLSTNYCGNKSDLPGAERSASAAGMFGRGSQGPERASPAGRWPPNVVLDEEMAVELDRQSGVSVSRASHGRNGGDDAAATFGLNRTRDEVRGHDDTGGASRFFQVFKYTAKAPGSERPTANGISHATVKPLELMRWLVRLITPPHGLVLDPFAGSGTTAEACIHEHMRCITIEREADYLPLIVARLSKPMAVGFDFEEGA